MTTLYKKRREIICLYSNIGFGIYERFNVELTYLKEIRICFLKQIIIII